MTDKKIAVYPTTTPDTSSRSRGIHDAVGHNLHNYGFSHNTSGSASFTYHDRYGNSSGSVSNSWYSNQPRGYRVDPKAENYDNNNRNPFSKTGLLRIEAEGSYDHSYSTWFEVGSDNDKLWIPNATGIGMSMKATVWGGGDSQRPYIRGIYGGYINHSNTTKVFKYPFQTDGDYVLKSGGSFTFKYAEFSSGVRDYIRDNKYKFNKLYFDVYIYRSGAKSKQPLFEFSKIAFKLTPTDSSFRFVVPSALRTNRESTVKYI